MKPRNGREQGLMQIAAAVVGAAGAAQVVGPEMPIGIEQHLNTYADKRAEGLYAEGDRQASLVGADHRRIIVRDAAEGLYVGGVRITDEAVATGLVDEILRMVINRRNRGEWP
jgi:hypothetical protein